MFSYCTDTIVAKVQNIFDCNLYKLIPETISRFLVSKSKVFRKLTLLVCTGLSIFICVITKCKRKVFQPKAVGGQ